MRIAFLCTSGLDNASPRGRWLPIARELAKRGHEPHLLLLHPTLDRTSDHEREFTCNGVHIRYVAQMHAYGLPGERRYFGPAALAAVSLRAATALANRAIQLKPDAIHVCKPQPINGLAGWIAARALRCPLFVDCDDYEAEANRVSNVAQRLLIRWWEDHLPRSVTGVTVNTRFLQARCQALGVAAERIAYVPNGADLPTRSPAPAALSAEAWPANLRTWRGKPVVIYVGTLSTIAHGVDLLLDAFALVLKRAPDARLLMVGDGDDRERLHAQAEQLGIAPAVHWAGRAPPERIPLYFSTATCSVDPVRDTPATRARSPLKIAESLAAGVPVVTGDVGDRREMLANSAGGAGGLLVKPSDAAALADGICDVLADPALQASLAHAANQRAAARTWARLCEDWTRIYDNRE